MNEALEMWTIYDHPKDLPNFFVARLWYVDAKGTQATDNSLASKSLEKLRTLMRERGLTCIHRDPNDDPVIVETWV